MWITSGGSQPPVVRVEAAPVESLAVCLKSHGRSVVGQTRGQISCFQPRTSPGLYLGSQVKSSKAAECVRGAVFSAGQSSGVGGPRGWRRARLESGEQVESRGTSCRAKKDASLLALVEVGPHSQDGDSRTLWAMMIHSGLSLEQTWALGWTLGAGISL